MTPAVSTKSLRKHLLKKSEADSGKMLCGGISCWRSRFGMGWRHKWLKALPADPSPLLGCTTLTVWKARNYVGQGR